MENKLKKFSKKIVERILISLQFDCNVGVFSIDYLAEEIIPILNEFIKQTKDDKS